MGKNIASEKHRGIVVGEGLGECSSHEEKYAWRKVVCEAEWEATDDADTGPAQDRRQKGTRLQDFLVRRRLFPIFAYSNRYLGTFQ